MAGERQQLSQREIDQVLGHYAVGEVKAIRELAQGSVYSPKVIIETERGKLLLKRRARGLDLPALVGFGHEVLLACLAAGLCVPPLLGTSQGGNSMVQFEDHIYELFAFIDGDPFDQGNLAHARGAGALLREAHTLMDGVKTSFEPSVEPRTIDTSRLGLLTPRAAALAAGLSDDLSRLMGYGAELAQANATRPALVHGDWHPGNMIFRGEHIVAICDFDNTRVGSRAREVAQAMVHVSLIAPRPGQTAAQVAPEPELDILRAFWEGYRAGAEAPCSVRLCLGLMPAVMIDEALASLPSAPPPNPAQDPSAALLTAVWRKAVWLDEHQRDLLTLLGD